MLFECPICIYVCKAVCKLVVLSSFSQWRSVLWCLTRILGKKECSPEYSQLPLDPHLSGRCFSPGDRISIISYASLYPSHIKFHFFNFWVYFGNAWMKMFSFLSPLAACGATYEIVFYWMCKTAPLIPLPVSKCAYKQSSTADVKGFERGSDMQICTWMTGANAPPGREDVT